MDTFSVTLAGTTLSIRCRHPFTRAACKGYEAPASAAAAFSVAASQEEIDGAAAEGAQSPAYGEFICLHRQIAEAMPKYGAAVMHGAAISYEGAGILFMAPSGTGKSTHIRLWRQVFGSQVAIINGDKPLVGIHPCPTLYGSPWAGKEGWQKNTAAPLKAICLLQRGTSNRIQRLDGSKCLARLLQQVYLPKDPEAMAATLALFGSLLEQVPIYQLECNMDPQAAQVACRGMTEALK